MIEATVSWFNKAALFGRNEPSAPAATTGRMDARIQRFCAVKSAVQERQQRVETRTNNRFVPIERDTFVTCSGGEQIRARIINISSKSVAIEADFSTVDSATVTKIGTRRVKPGRHMLAGRVFFFERPLSASLCHPDIIL